VLAVASAQVPGNAATLTQGQAQAVLAKVVPYVGVPGVNASIGLSTAQVSGSSAQASAATADFGLLSQLAGGVIPSYPGVPPITLPEPANADSEKQQVADSDPIPVPGQTPSSSTAPSFTAAHQHATATKGLADSIATGPGLHLPGVITIDGGRSEARSDPTRSWSDVTIGSVGLGDGAVLLQDLHWTATQVAAKPGVAGFSLGGLVVNGQLLPVASPQQLAAGLDAARSALAPFGLALSVPAQTGDANGATVAPLVLQVRNPETVATQTQQATAHTTPVLAPVMTQLLASMPNAQASQLVVNALLGGVGGQSGGRLELGGVFARSVQSLVTDDTDLTAPVLPAAAGPIGSAAPGAAAVAPSGGPLTDVPAAAPVADDVVDRAAGAPPPDTTRAGRPAAAYQLLAGGSAKHGAMVAMALAVLALAGQAVADRVRAALRAGR
jgi:hypothetical protein